MTADGALGAQLLFYAGRLVPEATATQSASTSVMMALLLVPESTTYKPVLAVGLTASPVVLHFGELDKRLSNPAWHRIDIEVSKLVDDE